MYPELKLLGLRLVADVVGFQKPCPLQSSRNGLLGRMKNQDRLAHHEGVDPYQTGSGRSVARTCGFSPLSLSCTAASLRTLFRARLPQQCHTIVGVSTLVRFVPWRLLSHGATTPRACQAACAEAGSRQRRDSALPPTANAGGLPRLKAVHP